VEICGSRALNYYMLLGLPSSYRRRRSRRSLWDSGGMVSGGAGRLARPAGGGSPGIPTKQFDPEVAKRIKANKKEARQRKVAQ